MYRLAIADCPLTLTARCARNYTGSARSFAHLGKGHPLRVPRCIPSGRCGGGIEPAFRTIRETALSPNPIAKGEPPSSPCMHWCVTTQAHAPPWRSRRAILPKLDTAQGNGAPRPASWWSLQATPNTPMTGETSALPWTPSTRCASPSGHPTMPWRPTICRLDAHHGFAHGDDRKCRVAMPKPTLNACG